MIAIIYLLTSKWHDVDESAVMVMGLIDILMLGIFLAFVGAVLSNS